MICDSWHLLILYPGNTIKSQTIIFLPEKGSLTKLHEALKFKTCPGVAINSI